MATLNNEAPSVDGAYPYAFWFSVSNTIMNPSAWFIMRVKGWTSTKQRKIKVWLMAILRTGFHADSLSTTTGTVGIRPPSTFSIFFNALREWRQKFTFDGT